MMRRDVISSRISSILVHISLSSWIPRFFVTFSILLPLAASTFCSRPRRQGCIEGTGPSRWAVTTTLPRRTRSWNLIGGKAIRLS
ncbi:hypothetical protein QBC43DRAFT_17152 [Cladorrhinum sp. PSN259]|nr:hypothetical protein QBC43DRAFT_17152 [Cladorrhinum sp. PSN259]